MSHGIVIAMKKVKSLFEYWSSHGINFPYAFDARARGPSVTLLFTYLTFFFSIISLVAFHFKASLFMPCLTTMFFWIMATTFYLIRTGIIHKAKFDLQDKSIEIEAKDNDTKN